MNDDRLTIEQQIRKLADGTDAPPGFLDQVRKLFRSKGIELTEDATPYMSALREAFRREQTIRRSTLDAHRNLDRLQTHFKSIGTTYRRQLQQLKQVQRALERRATALEAAGDDGSRGSRRYVTRVQKDDPFLVPGPDELQ
jgi:hypothetical protein